MKNKVLDRFHLLTYALSIVGWAMLIYALLVFDEARPEMDTIITNYFSIEVRDSWLAVVYLKLRFLLWFCAATSLLNLLLNWYLKITYRERMSLGIVLLFVVSSAAITILTILQPLSA